MNNFIFFDKKSIYTPGFFLSTIIVCDFEIFTHLKPGGSQLLFWAVLLTGAIIATLIIPSVYFFVKRAKQDPTWYNNRYHLIASCSITATILVTHTTPDPEVLYLPLFVAICLHSHGYIVGTVFNQRLGTTLIIATLVEAILRTLYTPWDPMLFILTMGVVVFAALLIQSLHVAHLRNATLIKDKAEAFQSLHDLLVVVAAKEIHEQVENITVLASQGSLGYRGKITKQIVRNVGKIQKTLEDCKLESRTKTSLQEVLSAALEFSYVKEIHTDIHGMTIPTVQGYHRLFLIILLHKILENICDAARINSVDLVVLKIMLGPSGIIIEDNVGRGHASSWNLRNYIDPTMQSLFGFQMVQEGTASGARYTLTFQTEC